MAINPVDRTMQAVRVLQEMRLDAEDSYWHLSRFDSRTRHVIGGQHSGEESTIKRQAYIANRPIDDVRFI